MKIKFNLNGVERVIVQNGTSDFTSLIPGTDRPLGYYSTLGAAVLKHVKSAAIKDSSENEEVIELKDYISEFRAICEQILSLDIDDVSKFSEIEKREKKAMSEERKAKMKAAKAAKKELENNIPIEEDYDDGL